jgi:hypothetical protein
MTGKRCILLIVLLFVPSLRADEDKEAVRVPVLGRPEKDFYGAIGTKVSVRLDANPTELSADEWLTLTLTITGLQNAPSVERPDLKSLKEFTDRFQIEYVPSADIPDVAPDRRVFMYRLRPHNTGITVVPPLKFHYFNPKAPPELLEMAFPFTHAESVPIRVRPSQAPPPRQIGALEVPAFAQQIATGEGLLSASRDTGINRESLIVLFALAALVAVAWVFSWRVLYPDEARRTLHRQSRAARRALSQLDRLRRREAGDIGAAVAAVVLSYLHERSDLPPWAHTPGEVADQLSRTQAPAEAVAAARNVLRMCDEARFAPAAVVTTEPLILAAQQFISLLEGEP